MKQIGLLVLALLWLMGCQNTGDDRENGNSRKEQVDSIADKNVADEHYQPSEDEIQNYNKQEITITDFAAEGLILDIGGGGEGVIGQMKGEQVVAIDISMRELADAPNGPLKIEMDARDLKFTNESFNVVTIFYTLMYVNTRDHEKIFEEVYRVLRSGGRFLVWDVAVPDMIDDGKKLVAFPFNFSLPNGTVSTGYGTVPKSEVTDLAYYEALAKRTGFQVVSRLDNEPSFFIELQKQ